MNSLVGVLFRFCCEDVAAMCNMEQMFHSFHVDPKHKDFLHFLWFKYNIPSQPIIEYRMTVHLFRNGPSPAVATYGLRTTVKDGKEWESGVRVLSMVLAWIFSRIAQFLAGIHSKFRDQLYSIKIFLGRGQVCVCMCVWHGWGGVNVEITEWRSLWKFRGTSKKGRSPSPHSPQ